MKTINLSNEFTLVMPDPERDAPFALEWFNSADGRETLLLMGNPEQEIAAPTLEGEKKTLQTFLELEKTGKQFTWMIRQGTRTVGAIWIELDATDYVRSPAIHIMIGDKNLRGKGLGRVAMTAVIDYAVHELRMTALYSRHLVANHAIAHVLSSLGFQKDGDTYVDKNKLVWQNVKLYKD